MSPRLLIVLLAFFSFGIAFAEDQPRQTEHSSATIVKPPAFTVPSSGNSPATYNFADSSKRLQVLDPSLLGRNLGPNADATCFTMRTYMVKRDDRDSDTVHPGGYTTCQPSPRFDVKITRKPVEPVLAW